MQKCHKLTQEYLEQQVSEVNTTLEKLNVEGAKIGGSSQSINDQFE